MNHTPNLSRRPRRRNAAGFTLAEVLLAGTLGALLLMSLAASTVTMTENLHDLEVKAGIAHDENAVLGQLTRDIREAWTATVPTSNSLQLFDSEGNVTEWYLEGGNLVVEKPDGDVDSVIEDITSISFVPTYADRHREGTVASYDTSWYAKGALATPAVAMALEEDDSLSLAFSVPIDDVAVGGSGDEQVLTAQAGILTLPIAWGVEDGHSPGDLSIELYAAAAPGSADPIGAPLGAVTLDGAALPAAVENEWTGGWTAPSTEIGISLASMGVDLEPGRGYAIVLRPEHHGELVLKSHMVFGSPDDDDTSLSVDEGSFVVQSLRVPYSLSGLVDTTTTVVTSEISRISITLVPNGRPVQTRSAALLNQVLSDDPWLGSVAGESAPTNSYGDTSVGGGGGSGGTVMGGV